jgi:hypothetical protein
VVDMRLGFELLAGFVIFRVVLALIVRGCLRAGG